ncbi:MAG: hypothetical protein ABSB19_20035, partial [Methylomonas sp.]
MIKLEWILCASNFQAEKFFSGHQSQNGYKAPLYQAKRRAAYRNQGSSPLSLRERVRVKGSKSIFLSLKHPFGLQ